jgi:UDP-N-acetylmuramate-alanine ligase
LKKGSLPWVKLLKTTSRKSERCYLAGTHEKGGKPSLIVEVAKRRSLQYHWIIDSIMEALKKANLTKEEALQMREDLCAIFFEKGLYIVFFWFLGREDCI